LQAIHIINQALLRQLCFGTVLQSRTYNTAINTQPEIQYSSYILQVVVIRIGSQNLSSGVDAMRTKKLHVSAEEVHHASKTQKHSS
jgi:hypothetical protein